MIKSDAGKTSIDWENPHFWTKPVDLCVRHTLAILTKENGNHGRLMECILERI
jgi:hypothetical protein